jgi:hypothetical protein
MDDQNAFRRIAAISAIFSAPVALLSTFIAIYAVGFDFDLLDEPVGLIALGVRSAVLFRWSWILAAFGFYLLLVPAVLYLQSWLDSQAPNLVRMYTVFGLGYCLIGLISLFTMATVLSPMMQGYVDAPQAERSLWAVVFEAVANLASMGLSPLAFIFGGVWWLGMGLESRNRHLILSAVTVALGAATLGSGLGYLIRVAPLARLEMINYFLGPIWAAWLGIIIWRITEEEEAPSWEQATAG